MLHWEKLARNSLKTGGIASAATTLAVAACGEWETRNSVAPLNAVSHIIWGDQAANQVEPSFKYTVTGAALNAAAITSWAAVHELLFHAAAERRDWSRSLWGGALVSGLAYVTDYYIVPARLTPGFEKRLSNRSLFGIYAVLAVALGMGSMLGRQSASTRDSS